VSVAAYVLVSSVDVTAALAGAREILVVPAVLASAFFWWFALALFEDGLRPRAIHAVPAILLLVFYAIRRSADGTLDLAGELLHQAGRPAVFPRGDPRAEGPAQRPRRRPKAFPPGGSRSSCPQSG